MDRNKNNLPRAELPPDPEEDSSMPDAQREQLEKMSKGLKGWRKKRGFPPKDTSKSTKAEALQALKDAKGKETVAAKTLGVAWRTWEKYKKKWPELNDLADDYQREKVEKVVDRAFKEATKKDDPNDNLIRFILDRHKLAESFGFVKKFKDDAPQIQVNIGNQVAINLTEEMRTQLLDRVKRRRLDEYELKQMDEGLKELEARELEASGPPLLEEKKEQNG